TDRGRVGAARAERQGDPRGLPRRGRVAAEALGVVVKNMKLAGPRIERDVELDMMGDWGIANLHRICGWIAAETWFRSGDGSRFATVNGRGGRDAIEAV